ncbi:ribonucleotide reductase N-terminal alpha domain-containing protein [Elstera litoralis]
MMDGDVRAYVTAPSQSGPTQAGITVQIDRSRDALLTDFGKETLRDRYLLPGESFQDLFARVASAYADDADHAQRLYDYMSRLWFMPATPVLSNGGTGRGLPISCYLNSVDDSVSMALSIPGTRMFGCRRAAAALAPIGARFARLASPSALMARPAASSPSSALWIV